MRKNHRDGARSVFTPPALVVASSSTVHCIKPVPVVRRQPGRLARDGQAGCSKFLTLPALIWTVVVLANTGARAAGAIANSETPAKTNFFILNSLLSYNRSMGLGMRLSDRHIRLRMECLRAATNTWILVARHSQHAPSLREAAMAAVRSNEGEPAFVRVRTSRRRGRVHLHNL